MRTEDGKIIRQCLDGESEAFGLLIDKYKASIYALVYAKVRNFHDAQDITQEVFLEAYRDLRSLRRWDSFLWWLYSIAYNQCKDWLKAQYKRPDIIFIEDQEELEKILESSSVNTYHESLAIESLHETLDSLPNIYREVLTLYYLGGMDSVEIAQALGTTPTAIRHRLSRARAQLKGEVLSMMSDTFEEHRLQANFTFKIVEAIKRIKIHPTSIEKSVPWGISIAAGIILTVLSIGSNMMLSQDFGAPVSFALTSESRVLNIGEIPVDVVKTSDAIAVLNPGGKNGESKQLDTQNAFMAPQAEGSGTWVQKSNLPFGMANHSVISVNDKIYIIGGVGGDFNANIETFSSIYEYEPKKDNWIKKADMPVPKGYFRSSVVDGKIYAIGGWSDGNFSNAVVAYDLIIDNWEKKADIPTARAEAVTEQVNGKIYVMGGHNQHSGKCLSIVEEYDPKTNTWTRKNDMPVARTFATSCVINDKIYVFGGASELVANLPLPVDIYDPFTDNWIKGSDIPTPRLLSSSCIVNEMVYIMGGDNQNGIPTSVLEIYNPVNNTWTKGENMPFGIASSENYPVIDGKIYIIGGINSSGQFLTNVWEFTPENLQSAISPHGKFSTTWGSRKSN